MTATFTRSELPFDQEMIDIDDYVMNYEVTSDLSL